MTWIYVVILHFLKSNQREPNPSLLRGSQALKPLRYNALLEKRPNKTVYKKLYKLWIDFSRKWLSIGHKFLCSSTLLVEYYTTKKTLLKSVIHNSRTPLVSGSLCFGRSIADWCWNAHETHLGHLVYVWWYIRIRGYK